MAKIELIKGDCLIEMQNIADGSIDCIICDLPYGTTACKWDIIIPFEPLWEHYKRVIKKDGAIVLFGSEPFSSHLRISNAEMYKYDWIWDKVQPSGQMTAKYMPMKLHEIISVFYNKPPTYNRQFTKRDKQDIRVNAVKNKGNQKNKIAHAHLGGAENKYADDYDQTLVNPKSIIQFSKQPDRNAFLHPTQKPVDLLRYLIQTYTNENETVLDNTMGSGTTGLACYIENRNFIGIEMNNKYFDIAQKRIKEAQMQTKLF